MTTILNTLELILEGFSIISTLIVTLLILAGVAWVYFNLIKIIMEWIVAPFLFFIPMIYRYHYIQKHLESKSNQEHSAIIIANNYYPERFLVYINKINLLIKYFKLKNIPYKVHLNVNRKRLKEIIYNKKAKNIYIVGHGQRHGLKLSKKDVIYYCEVKDAPKKDFIVQLHCNHNFGKSLVEYIGKDGFVSKGKLSLGATDDYLLKIYKKAKKEAKLKRKKA